MRLKPAVLALTVILVLTTLPAAASDGVLVPIFLGGPGAYGSVWRTRLTIVNDSDQPLSALPLNYYCGITQGCFQAMVPKSTATMIAGDGFRYASGFFLFTGIANPEVSYSLRVYDESRRDVNYGTGIPVVPLDDFTERRLQLIDIPVDAAFRTTLRIYAIPPAAPRVRVFVYKDTDTTDIGPVTPPALLLEQEYDLAGVAGAVRSFSPPSGIVVSDLIDRLPAGTQGPVRIQVQSSSAGVPVWALASVTNNATQMVTIVAPHHAP